MKTLKMVALVFCFLLFSKQAFCDTICPPGLVLVLFENVEPLNRNCQIKGSCYIESEPINGIYLLEYDYSTEQWVYASEDVNRVCVKWVGDSVYYASGLEIRIKFEPVNERYVISATSSLDCGWLCPYASYFYGGLNMLGYSFNEQTDCFCDACSYCYGYPWSAGTNGTALAMTNHPCGLYPFKNLVNFIDYAELTSEQTDIEDMAVFCQLWLFPAYDE